MTCRDYPCDFRVEDTDDYSPYCLDCGRRDPLAELILSCMERDAEIADALAHWTVRADDDFEFTDEDGNFFHVRVLGHWADPRVPRYNLYAKRAIGWDFVGVFSELSNVVPAMWKYATRQRLERMGVSKSPVDPPF